MCTINVFFMLTQTKSCDNVHIQYQVANGMWYIHTEPEIRVSCELVSANTVGELGFSV